VVRRTVGLPQRLLLIGLPLTIVCGFLVALPLFPTLGLFGAALLATLLAPTDAALGAPVVSNEAVPVETREALNLESGLNDGICVPVVVILLDLAVGTEIEHRSLGHAIAVVMEEIGIGLIPGLVLTAIAVTILRIAMRRHWISAHWLHVPGWPWPRSVSPRRKRWAAAASSRASSADCCSAISMTARRNCWAVPPAPARY